MNERECIACHQVMESGSQAYYGAQQVEVGGLRLGGGKQYDDGDTGWLHASCFHVPEYRQLPPPEDPPAA
jgi:hypothetical protein